MPTNISYFGPYDGVGNSEKLTVLAAWDPPDAAYQVNAALKREDSYLAIPLESGGHVVVDPQKIAEILDPAASLGHADVP